MTEIKKTEKITKILELLGKPLPEEAIQRTKAATTHKSYDTDGYGYQYCVDRFNELLGEQWGFDWEILKEIGGKYSTGKPYHDITVKVSVWINNRDNIRSAVGGHIAVLYADALKGAITNAFKKTAAFWGVGRQAYLGMLDDDNKPLPKGEINGNGKGKKENDKSQAQLNNQKEVTTEAQYKNEIVIMAIFLVYREFPDGSPDYLKHEARKVYVNAGTFQMKDKETDELLYDNEGNPRMKDPPNDIQKLSLGWAKKIHHVLKDKLHARNLKIEDALAWWKYLGDKVNNYNWWDIKDIPF